MPQCPLTCRFCSALIKLLYAGTNRTFRTDQVSKSIREIFYLFIYLFVYLFHHFSKYFVKNFYKLFIVVFIVEVNDYFPHNSMS